MGREQPAADALHVRNQPSKRIPPKHNSAAGVPQCSASVRERAAVTFAFVGSIVCALVCLVSGVWNVCTSLAWL